MAPIDPNVLRPLIVRAIAASAGAVFAVRLVSDKSGELAREIANNATQVIMALLDDPTLLDEEET